jgi:glycosyltransferase involved in cell wall biosynthesis
VSNPLVSVIVPTYKRLTYLRGALASALAQSYQPIEIIVSDDAASPKAAALVASFGDARLRYRDNGTGVGATRNALAAYLSARGEYVATLHDDDEWEPQFLERLMPPLIADRELSLAFSDHWIMGADGVVDPGASRNNTRRWRRDKLREGIYRPFHSLAVVDRSVPVVMAAVLRKSAIDWSDFPREMEPAYDLWLGYLASRDGAGA